MSKKLYEEENIQDIANAVREKNGKTDKYKVSELGDAVRAIEGGGDPNTFYRGFYLGKNAVKIAEYEENLTIADTSFVIGSQPTTSATSIRGSESKTLVTTGMKQAQDVICIMTAYCKPIYSDNAPKVKQQIMYSIASAYTITLTPSGKETSGGNYVKNGPIKVDEHRYYDTAGDIARYSAGYGIYLNYAPILNREVTNQTVRIATPTIYARSSSSYATATSMAEMIDCEIKWKYTIFGVDKGTSVLGALGAMSNDNFLIE